MKNKMKLRSISLSLLTAFAFGGVATLYAPSDAFAQRANVPMQRAIERAVKDVESAVEGTTGELKNLNSWIQKEQYKKLEQIRRDIVDAIGQSMTGVGTAVSQTGEIASHDRAENDQFEMVYGAIKSRPKDINCGNAGSGSAPSGTGTNNQGGGGGGGGGGGSFKGAANSNLKKAQAAAGLTDTVPKLEDIPPADVQEGMVGTGLCSQFATPGSTRGNLCALAEIPPKGDEGDFPNADVDGKTLFYGPQKKGEEDKKVKRNNFKAGEKEHDAMMGSLTVLFGSEAPPTLKKNEIKTESGMSFLGLISKWFANRDFAKQVAQNRVDSFIVDPDTKEAIAEIMAGDDADFLSAYLSDFDSWESDGVSLSLMRDIEVDRRASNPKWAQRVPGMDEAERQTEALYMQAQQLKMQRDQIEESITTNLLLAKILQTLNSGKMEEEITRNRLRAIKEASVGAPAAGG